MAGLEKYKTTTLVLIGVLISAKLLQVLQTVASSFGSDTKWTAASPRRSHITSPCNGTVPLNYPTDQTRDIVPKPIHSHNDYWRETPFYSAVRVGAISVEADVWLYNETLYVGHEPSALTSERTLDNLYIQPILCQLKQMNPSTPYIQKPTRNGLFDTLASQTLYLWIDFKTDGLATYPAVERAIEPLMKANYLTSVIRTPTENVTRQGPVTVIATGEAPLEPIEAANPRNIFYDAPLTNLNTTSAHLTPAISPIASAKFSAIFYDVRTESLSDNQLTTLRAQIAGARVKGMDVRYWDTPAWPIGVRNGIWKSLWSEGVTLLNVDDLQAAAALI